MNSVQIDLPVMSNQMTGDEGRAIRRHLHLSAREVADVLGLDGSTIYRWERRQDELVPAYYAVALRYMLEWPRWHRDDGDRRR